MRSVDRLFLAIGALAVSLASPSAWAFCRATTGLGQTDPTVCSMNGLPLAWPGGCAALSLDPRNVPADLPLESFRSVVTAAMDQWAQADCGGGTRPSFHFVAYPDCPHGAEWNPQNANANVVTFRTTWGEDSYHVPSAIAVTITTFNPMTGDIRDADTELNLRGPDNPEGFDFTTGSPSPTAADLPTVVTHELGHAQGLAHSGSSDAVMWYRAGLGEQRRTLTADDIVGICAIYPSSRSASCDPAPRGGFTCAPGCGCSIPGAPHEGASIAWSAVAVVFAAWFARRRRRDGLAVGALALLGCNEPRRTSAVTPTPAADPYGWTAMPDGTQRPPDGPCDRDDECALRTDCGCGCFAVRNDFTDPEHRCTRCAAQVPFCSGATARCDHATRHCTVTR